MSVFVNQSRLGALAQDTWFRVDRDPGQYEIRCTSAENSQASIVQLAADEIRFVEIALRFGIRTPRCAVVETTSENGRVAVLAGRRAQELSERTVARATPAGPISIIYRDDASNKRILNGVVSYGAVLGRDRSVHFTVKNQSAEPDCDGTFTKEGPNQRQVLAVVLRRLCKRQRKLRKTNRRPERQLHRRRGGYFTRRRPSSVRVTECRPPEMMSQSRLIEFAHDANRRLLDRANFWRASSACSALR
jgi:hypothetical protein